MTNYGNTSSRRRTPATRYRKPKTDKLARFVGLSLAIVIIYTIIEMVVSSKTGITHDTLTTCFFAVFGGEVVSCALIKIFKLKGTDNESTDRYM